MSAFTHDILRISPPDIPIRGTLNLPLSKSQSTRAAAMCFLSKGRLQHSTLSSSTDVSFLQQILHKLKEGHEGLLFAGEGGAVARFALPLAAITPGHWILDGSERLRERPIAPLFDTLQRLGADLNYAGRAGYLPVRIQGHPLRGGRASLDASISSQFASGLAMIAPLMDQGLSLELGRNPVSLPYLDLTLSMLTRLGMKAIRKGTQVRVEQGEYPDSMIHVEPDWSAAAFIYAAVALSPGALVRIPGLSLDSAQGDKQAANVFAPLGVNTSSLDDGIMIRQQDMASEEPIEADLRNSPDLLPALAVTAAMLERKALFHGMAHLRVKESDRIDAVLSLLRQCGYQASAGPDWLSVQGNTPGHCDPVIDPRNDHRLAMAFSLLCFRNEVSISHAGCVEKSWPDYWDSLSSLGFRIKQI